MQRASRDRSFSGSDTLETLELLRGSFALERLVQRESVEARLPPSRSLSIAEISVDDSKLPDFTALVLVAE